VYESAPAGAANNKLWIAVYALQINTISTRKQNPEDSVSRAIRHDFWVFMTFIFNIIYHHSKSFNII
jgi:hypothetical protein